MAWNRNSGGRWNQGGNQGPWGQPPQGGGRGEQPPDLEDLLKRSQDRLRRAFPAGFGGSAMIVLLAAALVVLWGLSGFYLVSAKENGVVLRFGKYAYKTAPGLQYHLPWPIETVYIPEVTRVFREDIGPSTSTEGPSSARTTGDDSLMLTKDRNFLIVNFTVQYQIKPDGAKDYLFNVNDPEQAVVDVSKAAMREVVGRSDFDALQTDQRAAAEQEAKVIIQQTLDSYRAGITVAEINIQRVDPPDRALDAAREVETARQEKETARNNAEAYQNKIIPEARGQAERTVQEAQAYKQRVVAEAQGESQRFNSVYEQYRRAPDVTRRRMYLETMEELLSGMNKVIIDKQAGGVVPYLPLPALRQGSAPASTQGGN